MADRDNLQSLKDRCNRIEMLIVDVDGVLTDGSITYADNEVELKTFHVRDGSGVKLWQMEGKRTAIITGRTSPVVAVRAAEIGIDPVIQGTQDKLVGFRRLLADSGLRPEQTAYVGDDLPDLAVFGHCGLAVAVADACTELRQHAHYVTLTNGGRGAVRETVELILRCQGRWQRIVERFRSQAL